MTPKEKAEELFKQMYQVRSVSGSDISKYFAKQCAIIAVDELIKATTPLTSTYYWQEVKQEIGKL
jgi:hypothetical protein